MKVAYDSGGLDDRELGAADLKKAGVEGFTKTLFPRGQAVEVSDEVGEALLNHELFDGFTEVKDDEPEQPEAKAADDKGQVKEAAKSGTGTGSVGVSSTPPSASQSGSTPAGTGSTA